MSEFLKNCLVTASNKKYTLPKKQELLKESNGFQRSNHIRCSQIASLSIKAAQNKVKMLYLLL